LLLGGENWCSKGQIAPQKGKLVLRGAICSSKRQLSPSEQENWCSKGENWCSEGEKGCSPKQFSCKKGEKGCLEGQNCCDEEEFFSMKDKIAAWGGKTEKPEPPERE